MISVPQLHGRTHPKLVLHEFGRVFLELIEQGACCHRPKILQTPLQDSAAVRVRRKFVHTALEQLDECQPLNGYALDQLLHNLCSTHEVSNAHPHPIYTD